MLFRSLIFFKFVSLGRFIGREHGAAGEGPVSGLLSTPSSSSTSTPLDPLHTQAEGEEGCRLGPAGGWRAGCSPEAPPPAPSAVTAGGTSRGVPCPPRQHFQPHGLGALPPSPRAEPRGRGRSGSPRAHSLHGGAGQRPGALLPAPPLPGPAGAPEAGPGDAVPRSSGEGAGRAGGWPVVALL